MAEQRRGLIAVIGDGSTDPRGPKERLAAEVGEALVDAGFRVLTGGLGGVMSAACRGARRSARYQPGDTVAVLPGHDANAANEYVDIALPTGLGDLRNVLCAHADGIVAVGGGAGTLSELAYGWMLGRPIAALRIDGWSGELAGRPIDGRRDDVVMGANTAAEAVEMISRQVG